MSDQDNVIRFPRSGRERAGNENQAYERLAKALAAAMPERSQQEHDTFALAATFPNPEAQAKERDDGQTSQVIAGDGNIQIATGRAVSQTIYGNCNIQIFSYEPERE